MAKEQEEKGLLEDKNTKNVLIVLLGWLGSNNRYLSKYNQIYDDYLDSKSDKTNDNKLKITIKSFIIPSHMFFCNVCMINKKVQPIVETIKSHRKTFEKTSYVIIHAFSNGGAVALTHINDQIKLYDNDSLYYNGIIYDSSDLSSMKIFSGMKALWIIMRLKLISLCVCYDIKNENNGFLWILCKIWSVLIYCMLFSIAVIIIPIIFLFLSCYIIITCSSNYIFSYSNKLMGNDDIKLLAIPTLLLGSDTDKINPINESFQWMDNKKYSLEKKLLLKEPDTILLAAGYNKQFINDSNRYVKFEKSEHVKHYKIYPKQYQDAINHFLDLCLQFN